MAGVILYGPATGANVAELWQQLLGTIIDHINDAEDSHDAATVSVSPTVLGSADVQAALTALASALGTDAAALAAHLADVLDAHDASAVSTTAIAGLTGADVQAMLASAQANITAEATTRAASDAVLTTNVATNAAAISAETTARIADVDAEEAGRIAAVTAEATARASAVTTEATTRAAADTTLTAALAVEVSNRTTDVDTEEAARITAVSSEATLARNADNLTSGTVADARIAATIARDSEVTVAVAAEAALARNADNLTGGTVADARIASTIARDSEVAAAIAASEAGQVRDGDAAGGALGGTFPNPSFAVDMATQAELDVEVAARIADVNTEEARALAAEALLVPLASLTELAQDAVGGALTDTSTIDLAYDDAAGQITAAVVPASITSSHIASDTITDVDVNSANKDGTAGTPSLRTLGTGATQAAAGNVTLNTAKVFGVLPNGSDMTTELQAWLTAQGGRAGLGIIVPGTYRQNGPQLEISSDTAVLGYGALLQAPSASAFNMLAVVGSSGAHKSNIALLGLAVDMRATGQAVDSNGLHLLYADGTVVQNFKAANCGFEGFLDRHCAGTRNLGCTITAPWGDGVHYENSAGFLDDGSTLVGRGVESGVGLTGDTTGGIITNFDVSEFAIGIGASGCRDVDFGPGRLHDLLAASGATIVFKIERASGFDSESLTFHDILVKDIDPMNGFGGSFAQPNRTNPTRANTFRFVVWDMGARPGPYQDATGDFIYDGCTFRTTGDALTIAGRTATITNKALTANVATLTTSAPHGFLAGEVVVSGVDATFNGAHQITAVTSTTISFAKVAANVGSTAATGTADLHCHTTRIRRSRFIGCLRAIVTGINSGTVIDEGDNEYVDVGARYSDVNAITFPGDSGWIALTPNSGWANAATFPPLRYRLKDGVVHLQVAMSNTSGSSNSSAIATLPAGTSPDLIPPAGGTVLGDAYGSVQVSTAGVISPFGAVATGDGLIANLSWPAR